MLKQTMGTPFHSIPYRHDNKAYRLITPQKPLLRTRDYRHIDFDDYPTGVNAVVAVMCYTGYCSGILLLHCFCLPMNGRLNEHAKRGENAKFL